MSIREANVEDIDSLYACADEFFASSTFLDNFKHSCFKDTWNMFLTNKMGVIFILEHLGEVSGAIGGIKYPDPNNGELNATELFWFVKKEKRGQGLLLLREFEKWAKDNHCKNIMMVHLIDLMPDKVKMVYEKFGYQPIEIHYRKELM